MGFLIEGYSRVGGGIFAIGLIVALLGMVLTVAPEVLQNETTALRVTRVAVGMTVVGVIMMMGAAVAT